MNIFVLDLYQEETCVTDTEVSFIFDKIFMKTM